MRPGEESKVHAMSQARGIRDAAGFTQMPEAQFRRIGAAIFGSVSFPASKQSAA
jgi:hypothetical protein